MTDRRPDELKKHLEAAPAKNDKLILQALAELEDPAKRGKRKATVAIICRMTGLSRNTVRSRPWALSRLKAIKLKLKAGVETGPEMEHSSADREPTPRMLRDRIKSILAQNALLYEEIVSLRASLSKKETTIRELTATRVVPSPPPHGRASE